MARLRMLGPRLRQLPPRVAPSPQLADGRDRARDAVQPWRAWYKTARWQKLRWSVLLAAGFACAMCGRVEGRKGQLVADHICPHRGDERAFWDRDNLQCLCKACHDSTKQRNERRGTG